MHVNKTWFAGHRMHVACHSGPLVASACATSETGPSSTAGDALGTCRLIGIFLTSAHELMSKKAGHSWTGASHVEDV